MDQSLLQHKVPRPRIRKVAISDGSFKKTYLFFAEESLIIEKISGITTINLVMFHWDIEGFICEICDFAK